MTSNMLAMLVEKEACQALPIWKGGCPGGGGGCPKAMRNSTRLSLSWNTSDMSAASLKYC